MQRKLVEAARQGDVRTLHDMIKDDPFLSRAAALLDGDNPLHIACVTGNLDFVKVVMSLRPEFAVESSQDGFSPLHIASANGDVEIVKELLKVGSHLCLVQGKDGRTPLHYAVMKGRKEAITELLSACPDSVQKVSARGENCLHLAVNYNRLEAFKFLVEFVIINRKEDVFNTRDGRGNTILHLAARGKLYEVLSFLLDGTFSYNGILEDINSLNKSGLTPLDMLLINGGDCDIEEMLRAAGAKRFEEMQSTPLSPNDSTVMIRNLSFEHEPTQTRDRPQNWSYKKLQKFFKYSSMRESPNSVRNTLLVIAILITTASYQVVLSPPGGVWQDDWKTDNSSAKQPPSHTAGKSVMATRQPLSYGMFLFFNSIGFFMSQFLMYFLTDGLPLQFELRVSLIALAFTYDVCMVAVTPNNWMSTFFIILSSTLPVTILILAKIIRCRGKR